MWFFKAVLVLALLTPLRCRKAESFQCKNCGGKGRVVKLVMDPNVTQKFHTSFSAATANLSVSPWIYRAQCVASRVPRCLYHAHCLTSGCINPQTGLEDLSLETRPIYYQLLVLHRVQRRKRGKTSPGASVRGKRYDLRLGTEVVSVGCTCVRPSVLTHN